MKISKEKLQQLARRAKLHLSPRLETQLRNDMEEILRFLEKLDEVSPRTPEKIISPVSFAPSEACHTSERSTRTAQEILQAAPQRRENLFLVKGKP
ncbi:MAG TPA: Asp-tRNA(Asn)/Glu-tRNA(Gln) amidotransferase subunit GatC [Thermotogota bacterium]|nr:Asp-tRNA(Asn)/Glu-tRNA(Gln) amidotransferase subunit GatC [Thermotogota bacterium]HRW93027.1 Asp-tRNA(Asn)/Glu-tRNA(Gln) amidotransferase subunit GatC [Thermotogota bacterium]